MLVKSHHPSASPMPVDVASSCVVAVHAKTKAAPKKREKWNPDEMRLAMSLAADVSPSSSISGENEAGTCEKFMLPVPVASARDADVICKANAINFENPGLTRAELEDQRWAVCGTVAKAKFLSAGIILEGRSARKIYSWPLILMIEGVPKGKADLASPDTHPTLFDDLITVEVAARIFKVSPQHLRKIIAADQLSGCDIIRFGQRGMYRFRPGQVEAEARRILLLRIVEWIPVCTQ